MSNLSEITEIFDRCIKNTATEAERTFFYDWAEVPGNRVHAIKLLENAFSNADRSLDMDAESGEAIIEAVLNANRDVPHSTADLKPVAGSLSTTLSAPSVHRVHFLRAAWFRYAAIFLLLAGTAGYFFYSSSQNTTDTIHHLSGAQTIAPGKDGVILILADGTKMILDSLGNGIVASKAGAKIVLNDGQLEYEADSSENMLLSQNTIRTPKGRQFKVILSDGTAVWLNSESEITYPTAFKDGMRNVRIVGEAYFEVAQQKSMPFVVNVGDRIHVEVLGTHFNINAYSEVPLIKATLLEGSVKVYDSFKGKSKHNVILKPGQQAKVSTDTGEAGSDGSSIQIINADLSKVIAWKNGLFDFEDASLQEVMNQLERWYDIEVVYEKGVPDMYFVGKMSRGMQLPNLLKALEQSGVHFRLEEGRKLVVMP